MAKGCTIPCTIGGVENRIRRRETPAALRPWLPIIGVGVVLLLATPVLIALANWQVAFVAAIFFLLGTGVVATRAGLAVIEASRRRVTEELLTIIDEHEAEIFPARLPQLRAEAAQLTYDGDNPRVRVNQFLEELREATGEAWRCPCRKRRLPIPLPLPF